jgi:hypothetical protein
MRLAAIVRNTVAVPYWRGNGAWNYSAMRCRPTLPAPVVITSARERLWHCRATALREAFYPYRWALLAALSVLVLSLYRRQQARRSRPAENQANAG